jgi:SAM-dependent methyltransferase
MPLYNPDFLSKAGDLRLNPEGIWQASQSPELSYPADGNERCFLLEDASFWFRHRNNCISEVFKRFRPDGPILDVGGGNGYVTRRLLDEGMEAVLLEPGAQGAWNGRVRRQIPRVVCGTLQDAGFEPESIPAIGLFDVLEHIKDDAGFIRDLHRVLCPDGLLCLTVPAWSWLWSPSDDVAGHFRRYRLGDLERLLSPMFTLEYASCFFSALVAPIFLLRVLPWRLGLRGQRRVLSDEQEHGTDSGVSSRILARLLEREVDRIRQGEKIRLGASCLIMARKAGSTENH